MLPILFWFAAITTNAQPADYSDIGVEQTKNGAFIFRKYPPRAKAAGEQGDVTFRAEYDKKGSILSCEVTKSSGFKRLDEDTCELIVKHARFKPELLKRGKRVDGIQTGLVEWRIPGAPPPVAVDPAKQAAMNNPDKIICKKIPRGGSLVIMSKQCLTQREWQFQADEAKDTIGEAQRRASERAQ
jgi:periplasmic protein TonB